LASYGLDADIYYPHWPSSSDWIEAPMCARAPLLAMAEGTVPYVVFVRQMPLCVCHLHHTFEISSLGGRDLQERYCEIGSTFIEGRKLLLEEGSGCIGYHGAACGLAANCFTTTRGFEPLCLLVWLQSSAEKMRAFTSATW